MEIEHIFSLRMFSIQGLACGLVLELHSQTEIELDSFIILILPLQVATLNRAEADTRKKY